MRELSLDEIKKIELKILVQFADFCDHHNLKYVLTGGTLIGAIRHHGFIPWDDDIDVLMPRNDYNELMNYYKIGKPIGNLELLYSTDTNDYYYTIAKLIEPNTIIKSSSILTKHGIWIDLFPYDKISENLEEAILFLKKMRFLRSIIISYDTDFLHRKIDKKTLPKIIISIFGKIYGKKRITKLIEKEALKYNLTDSHKVCQVVWKDRIGGIFADNDIDDRIKVSFEGHEFWAFRRYDEYLRSIYGDYMVIPPENKRETHSFKAYYISDEKDD